VAAVDARTRWSARLLTLTVLAGLIGLMQAITASGIVSTFLLPSPAQVAARFPFLITEEGLLYRLLLTAIEVFVAAGAAVVLGTFAGWLLYRSRDGWLAFNGWVAALNATPLILLYPLLLVVFGRGPHTIVMIGILNGLPPIVLKTREAFALVRPVLLEVGRSLNLAATQKFWLIQLPAAAPTIVAGVRLGSFYALIGIIGAEFLTGVGGLGALIPDLADRYKLPEMYGAIVFVILMSAAFIAIIRKVEMWLRPM
jgi:ABC-type nitrate/sulfonate/bicarbonate transport system permease component